MNDDESDILDSTEIRYCAEFCAWGALVMTPVTWWLQGASVSTDQFVVRTGLIVVSAVMAVGLRGWALIQRRRNVKAARSEVRREQQNT